MQTITVAATGGPEVMQVTAADLPQPEPGEVDSYVAWPFKREGDGSYQDMTVFGFGRKGLVLSCQLI